MRKTKKVLLTLIIICLLIISGTFLGYSATYSKYVDRKTSENISNIALFGVTMTWSEDAFLSEYEKGSPSRFVVKSDTKTMAPTISNNIILSLRGTCEVAFNLTIKIEEIYSDHWKESELTTAKPYHPIVLEASSSTFGAVTLKNNVLSMNYEAVGADLNEDITITWTWPSQLNNSADTYMSSLSNIATYSLSAQAVATQIV